MSIENADEATEVAREALTEAGYESTTIEEAHQETSTWIVQADDHDGTRLNVHIDAESGESEVAEIGD